MMPQREGEAAPLLDLQDKTSWAFLTFKNRLPQYVGDVLRDCQDQLPEEAMENLKQLRAELEQNSVIRPIQASCNEEREACQDLEEWQECWREHEGKRWDELPFFWLEAYFYRRLLQESRYFLTGDDPFSRAKCNGITESMHIMKSITWTLLDVLRPAQSDPAVAEEAIELFLLRSLWGNKADLSLFSISEDPLALVHQKLHKRLDSGAETVSEEMKHLLVDESLQTVQHLLRLRDPKEKEKGRNRVDIILDNSGMELFSDLCLAHVLAELLHVNVQLHLKRDPTFVSDATPQDVHQLINALDQEAKDPNLETRASADLSYLVQKWRHFIEVGTWRLRADKFWNSVFFFDKMSTQAPDLYGDMKEHSHSVVVKGDANYRRLVGDCFHPHTSSFASLTSYFPVHVVALRVLKSELVVGLKPGQAEAVAAQDARWLVNGKWATIQQAGGL